MAASKERVTFPDTLPHPRFRAPHSHVWIVAAAAFLTAGMSLIAMKGPGDDAHIVFRYVGRLLGGHGLTFNDGEFVEGFTSLSWTLLLAGVARVTGARLESIAVVLNFIIPLITILVLDRAVHLAGGNRTGRAATILAFSTAYAYFRVSFFGLELGLFGLLLAVFGMLMLAVSGRREGAASSVMWALGITGGLLFATRPEALLFVPATFAAMWLASCVRGREVARAAVPFAVISASVEVWRLAYYGDWLPNSAVAKSILLTDPHLGATIAQRSVEGFTYLYAAYAANPMLAVMVLAAIALGGLGALSKRSVLLFVPIACGHLVILENGGDWMPAYRLVTVYLPLYLLAGWSVAADLHARYGRRTVLLLTAVALLLHVSASVSVYQDEPYIAMHIELTEGKPAVSWVPASRVRGFVYLYETVARTLGSVWIRGDVLAAESIGTVGFVAPDVYIHDPNGVTNRYLAHDPDASQGTFGREDWRYSLSLKPAVILLHWWPHQAAWATYGAGYPGDFDRYCIRTRIPGYPSILFAIVRKDRPLYSDAIRSLGGRLLEIDASGNPHCRGTALGPDT